MKKPSLGVALLLAVLLAGCSAGGAGAEKSGAEDATPPRWSGGGGSRPPEGSPPQHSSQPVASVSAPAGRELSVQIVTGRKGRGGIPGELYLERGDGGAVGFRPGRDSANSIKGAIYHSEALEDDDAPGAPRVPAAVYTRMIEGVPADNGPFVLSVTGLASGAYTLIATVGNPRSTLDYRWRTENVALEKGEVHEYRISVRDTVVSLERLPR